MAYTRTQQQLLLRELTVNTEWNTLLTLTFPWSKHKKTHDDVTSTLDKFLWHVEVACYGRQAKANKLARFPVLEYSASEGSHLHILMVKPDHIRHSKFKNIVRTKWKRLDGTGKANMTDDSGFYRAINNTDEDRLTVFDYSSKAVKSNYDTVIFQSI